LASIPGLHKGLKIPAQNAGTGTGTGTDTGQPILRIKEFKIKVLVQRNSPAKTGELVCTQNSQKKSINS
jgi:hypothetical protein